jgi:flagellar biosynthesis/type III secretory pathway M-ring protein FliF/YscJ
VEYVIVLLVLFAVVFVVSGPLRRSRQAEAAAQRAAGPEAMRVIELEAAREAKYREIRDAELDHQTGKLSDEDFEAVDRTLRVEASEILHQLDAAREQQRTSE